MLKRIIWKESALLTFQIKENLFITGQMLKDPYICFFKSFSNDPEATLDDTTILFIVPVARDFLQRRTVKKINHPKNREEIDLPNLWISPKDDNTGGFPWKGGNLVEINHKVGDIGMDNKVIKCDINKGENDILDKYELTNIWTDGILIKRLILCFEEGKNVDPLKEKIFFGQDRYGIYD